MGLKLLGFKVQEDTLDLYARSIAPSSAAMWRVSAYLTLAMAMLDSCHATWTIAAINNRFRILTTIHAGGTALLPGQWRPYREFMEYRWDVFEAMADSCAEDDCVGDNCNHATLECKYHMRARWRYLANLANRVNQKGEDDEWGAAGDNAISSGGTCMCSRSCGANSIWRACRLARQYRVDMDARCQEKYSVDCYDLPIRPSRMLQETDETEPDETEPDESDLF